ncbi:MAG: glutamate--cysteine ligase [Gammaproteobacteria bacterium]|nr:glutamate--cysteine ligase [Gammaproteobacteria bacterium]MDP2139966.1 glutamate--cysteine ligase [Gammaproteobacteria bacterium]MDP2347786.1 glutamate--cysteine ligase [Gammaproteobacteria bacterium]
MTKNLHESLRRFNLPEFKPEWGKINRGIEKESLRVTPEGRLAQTDHPAGLGSALAHPYITTDYSEALLELITPVSRSIDECLDFLADLHTYTYTNLPRNERLWVSSMPCLLERDDQIPLARYGNSNIGKLKTLYREGLGHRYGRVMQTIAGIHYNFSMPESFWAQYRDIRQSDKDLQEFQTHQYLHLIRNFHRYCWLLPYLFGASPAVCKCFTQGREHDLQEFDKSTLYKPYATALRMGNLGYKSEAQKSLFVCYNDLDNYLDSLQGALSTPYPPYQEIGLQKNGHYQQINTNLLQLENEFYGTIRPKRVGESGERPLTLLRERGIQYIEVRVLDLNPFLPLGIDAEQIHFLDAFLLFCLLSESPVCTKDSYYEIEENLSRVVNNGREPGLLLSRRSQEVAFRDWADELLTEVGYAAVLLDEINCTRAYSQANAVQLAKLADPELTPSAQLLRLMRDEQRSFCAVTMEQSIAHEDYFRQNVMDEKRLAAFREASRLSIQKQAEIEASDTMSFDEFLQQWNAIVESQTT